MSDANYVLVVEDDPFYSKIYKTKLMKEGIECEVVGDGNAAFKKAKESRPGLILLDLIMPGKDGFETLAEFKADDGLKDVPVIVLSNLSQEEDIQRIMNLGAVEYLVKSNVPISEVVEKVRSNLKR